MKDWADDRAEKLLEELRSKPRPVVLGLLAEAFRSAVRELEVKLAKAEADLEVFEPVQEQFEGHFMESKIDGFCKDCGIPYAEGALIWWLGPGRGAYCVGCRKAEEWTNTQERSGPPKDRKRRSAR